MIRLFPVIEEGTLPLSLRLFRRRASGARAAAIAVALTGAAGLFTVIDALQMARSIYYVAPSGDDANPGTPAQPFRTIQRAADVVEPGDTVIVEDGTYTGTGIGTPCESATSQPVVCLTRGGTATAWVTFRSRRPSGARIDGQENRSTHGFRFLADANYIVLDGFELFGIGSTVRGSAGIQIYAGGHDVVIANNNIHDIGRLCTDHIYGMSGIYIQNARVTVEGNRVHHIGRFAPGENGCQPSTSNYQNHDHGIYVNGRDDGSAPGAADVTVTNNLFWNVSRGWPIQVYPDPVVNLWILHNTFAFANPYRVGHIIVGASTTNARIANNIFHEPLTAAVNFYRGTHSGLVITNNLTSRAIANATPEGVTFSTNLERTDPQFAPSGFQPGSGSPAIDRGLTLPEVRVDINGISRPQGAASDIGTFEFVGRVPPMVEITSPRAAEVLRPGAPHTIAWTASNAPVDGWYVSLFDGRTWTRIAECTNVPPDARECTWYSPSPVTDTAQLYVGGFNRQGFAASDYSDIFHIRDSVPGGLSPP